MPLALAQAAAVIRGQHQPYRTYLERLRALPVAEYLTRGPGQPYPHGVAEAVLLSLEAVQADDRGSVWAGMLELMSALSAAGSAGTWYMLPGERERSARASDGGMPGWARRRWMRRWGSWRSGRCCPSAWTARSSLRTAWCCGWSGTSWPRTSGSWPRAGPPPSRRREQRRLRLHRTGRVRDVPEQVAAFQDAVARGSDESGVSWQECCCACERGRCIT